MSRWVRTTVDMLDHDVLNVGPYDRRSAWMWLITHAAWKDKRVNHKGRPLELKRGQVLVGRAFLANTWQWSEQNVRTFVHLLVAEGMAEINQSSGHFANVLTICNYDKYQSVNGDDTPVDQPEPNQSLTSVQPEPNQTLTSTTSYRNNYTELGRDAFSKIDPSSVENHDDLQARLEAACGPSLANPANSPGLLNLSVPYGWLRHGADLQTVILPALKSRSANRPPGSIRSWDYFSPAVAENKKKVEAGLPEVAVTDTSSAPTKSTPSGSYRAADIDRARGFAAKLNLTKKPEAASNA